MDGGVGVEAEVTRMEVVELELLLLAELLLLLLELLLMLLELLLLLLELLLELEQAESRWRLVGCARSPSRWTPSRHQPG